MVIVVSIVLIVNLSRSIWDLWRRRDYLGERQMALKRLESENKRLQTEFEYAQSPEFIEQEARNRLGLGKEGEAIVLMPNGQQEGRDNKQETENIKENVPNWKRWWRMFF